MRLIPKRLRWMGLGALAAWLFDPERGRARRTQIADKASEAMKKTGLSNLSSADKVDGNGSIPSPASPTSTTSATSTSPRVTSTPASTTS
jgi:hypothetical protein